VVGRHADGRRTSGDPPPRPAELRLHGVRWPLPAPADAGPAVGAPAHLVVDHRGVVVGQPAAATGVVVPWAELSSWSVERADDESVVSLATKTAHHRVGVPATDAVLLACLFDDLAAGYGWRPTPGEAPTLSEPDADEPVERTGWRRAQPVLVVVLVVVLATAVGLVLAQSAGLVHLPLIGGNGGGPVLPPPGPG